MILNAKHFWTRWTTELRSWFTEKFNSVISHIPTDYARRSDLSPLAKSSELSPLAKSSELTSLAKDATVAKEAAATRNKEDVIRAIGAIPQPIIPTDYAKEATLSGGITRLRQDITALRGGTATVEQVKNIASALRNGLTQEDKTWLQHQFAGIDLSSITNILNNSTYGLQALKTLIETTQPDLSAVAKEAQATANKQEILTKIEGIGQYLPQDIATQSMLNALKTAIQGTDNTATLTAIQEAIDNIQIDLSPVISNQQKMMVNFGMSEGMPELVAMTDTEILNKYAAQDTGIADTTYGHRQPAQVTIDDVALTMYVERTYRDYGYEHLYLASGVEISVDFHPTEGQVLFTTAPNTND